MIFNYLSPLTSPNLLLGDANMYHIKLVASLLIVGMLLYFRFLSLTSKQTIRYQ